ncbi:hypothetical protein J3A83DRAFT_4188545 [Scleroderma citrinum]
MPPSALQKITHHLSSLLQLAAHRYAFTKNPKWRHATQDWMIPLDPVVDLMMHSVGLILLSKPGIMVVHLSGSYLGDELNYNHRPNIQGLHAVVAQLTANVKHLSEVKGTVEQIIGELQERGEQKLTTSRMNSNHHAVLKSIIQPLYFQLCGIKCDGTKANHIAALVAVKPLKNRQSFELSTKGLQIWHPNWLGKVDDVLNAKFIKEVMDHVFNNEKRAKELHSDQGTCKVKVRLEQGCQQAQCVTLLDVRWHYNMKLSLVTKDNEVSKDTLQQRKDAEVGQSANKVVGHAWRSIDYVAFLHWLSLHAMKQQQHTIEEPAVDQEPQCKQHRTTKKQHKQVFNIAPKYLNCDKPSTKGVIFKAMVNKGWYDQHPDTVVHEGVDWLKGFYSHINQSELFEADTTYLKELDTWLKEEAAGEYLGSDEEDE